MMMTMVEVEKRIREHRRRWSFFSFSFSYLGLVWPEKHRYATLAAETCRPRDRPGVADGHLFEGNESFVEGLDVDEARSTKK